MKTLVLKMWSLFFLMSGGIAVYGQQVPGDNFSLEGALELFKQSSSPEKFEQLLNSPQSKVNNLDLNNDGEIDYIRVIDRHEGNIHIFILQAVVSPTENQDIAVIELEKLSNGKAVLQIIGDEDIYGIETIIEPTQEVYINAGTSTTRTVVNVWAWPSVQYIYGPAYTIWISPWRWSIWPMWWSPWTPVAYYVYDPWWQPYRPYYSICYTHRVVYANQIYRPYRSTSVTVYNNHYTQINHYRNTHTEHHDNGNGNNHENGNGYGRGNHSGNGYGRDHQGGNDTGNNQHSGNGYGRGNSGNGNSNGHENGNGNGNSKGHGRGRLADRTSDQLTKPSYSSRSNYDAYRNTRSSASTNHGYSNKPDYNRTSSGNRERTTTYTSRSTGRDHSSGSSSLSQRNHETRYNSGGSNRSSQPRSQSFQNNNRGRSSGNSGGSMNRSGNQGGGRSHHGNGRN